MGDIMMDGGLEGASDIQLRTQNGLAKLVGYAEIVEAAGVSRSTIERSWRGPWDDNEPHLPRPGKIGARAVWTAQDVNDWLLARASWQSGRMILLARATADDLAPEALVEQAVDLMIRATEKQAGKPVDIEAMAVHVTRRVTENELRTLETKELGVWAARFTNFDLVRACILAAWLFPALRPLFKSESNDHFEQIIQDQEELDALACRAVHDEDWAVALEHLRRNRRLS
jgi:predicted DNA-binding transcriptional regulator AlpA